MTGSLPSGLGLPELFCRARRHRGARFQLCVTVSCWGLLPCDSSVMLTCCCPSGEKLDPRAAIVGDFVQAQPSPFDNGSSRPTAGQSQSGDWRGGLFDRDSWTEVHAGWARSVVTGRARLGGTPCGEMAHANPVARWLQQPERFLRHE